MKALYLICAFISLPVFIINDVSAQRKLTAIPKPVSGNETYLPEHNQNFTLSYEETKIAPVITKTATVLFSPTGIHTVYDLQSNAVPKLIWQDPLLPENVHVTFMYSLVPGFATRSNAYVFSSNAGVSWNYLGDVPSTGRAGFPSITGFSNGAAVIASHTTTNGTTSRTKIYYDAGPGFGVFTELDPGQLQSSDPIWPQAVTTSNSRVVFCSSVNAALGPCATNVATSLNPPGVFSGYVTYEGDNAGSYYLAISPSGVIGHAYTGVTDGINDYDVFYRSSTDQGITWSLPTRVWDFNEVTDSLGCLRGVCLVFGNNNQPYVVFNLGVMTFEGSFAPDRPSSIRVWSPNINGGIPAVIADSATVPFFPNKGLTSDGFIPLCRPSIGRSVSGSGLIVGFSATTGRYGGIDTNSYYSAWAVYSQDDGNTWSIPEQMTPMTPLRDWRYISVSPTNANSQNQCTAQLVCQSDSMPGTHVQGAEIGLGEQIGIRYIFPLSSIPSGPILTLPPDNSVNVSLTPLMDWNNVSSANTYRIQISLNNNFTTTVLDQSNLSSSQFQVTSQLVNNTLYYWRVNASNINGTGPWSAVWSFRTVTLIPPAPVLASPPNNSTGIILTPTIDWNDVVNALSYALQVSTDTGFTSLIINQSNLQNSQYVVPSPGLDSGTKYFWRVNATNNNGTGAWSSPWNFTTIGIPSAPNLLLPVNGATQVSLTPQLSWSAVASATSYNVVVSTDSNFITTVLNVSSISNTFYNVPSSILNGNTWYYWKVRAFNSLGYGTWSVIFNFRTLSPPEPPLLVYPANSSGGISLTPLMDWANVTGAISYRMQIATDSNFTNIILDPANLSGSQYQVTTPYLAYVSKYYWRANASNAQGAGQWSEVFNFTTMHPPPPSPPTLVSPVNGSIGISLTPLLDWNALANAISYTVQVASDVNFNNLVVNQQGVQLSEFSVPPSTLNYNSLYFWRVNATNGAITSEWSTVWLFRTLIITGLENLGNEIPQKLELRGNYPNPFNPDTKIIFDLPEAAGVEIIVYDYLGRIVRNLLKENLYGGSYSLRFNGDHLSSGVYFYSLLVNGKLIKTNKMLLLK